MKSFLVYGLVFAIVFFGITGLVIDLNDKYTNIFKLDFSKRTVPVDSIKLKDSLKIADSLNTIAKQDSIKKFEIEKKNNLVKQDSINHFKKTEAANNKNELEKAREDSIYADWKKATVKIFQSMDPKKAAKILQGYSDNTAREIIYSMNKKKAAEIISFCGSDYASKITRAN